MKSEKHWKEKIKLAKQYIALDQTDHYLYRDDDYPWEFATECDPGGGHRMEIATSVRFTADHPSGLKFSWTFEIEPHNASGSGSYHIDVEGCQKALGALKGKAKKQFAEYLKDCAHKVAAKGDEWKKIADDQFKTADDLMKAGKI